MKNAVVKFKGTTTKYHFMTDLELQIGDTVVCDTTMGLSVGTVYEVSDEVSKLATKWIVDTVDIANHKKRLDIEKKRKEIKAKMEKKRKQLEDIAVYTMLAKEDQEIAQLLEEYKSINII